MKCQRCESERVAEANAKCSDLFSVSLGSSEHQGYVPGDLGIGGGDYVEFAYCLDCGQLQGKFPRESAYIEKDMLDEEVADFFDNYFTEGTNVDSVSSREQFRIKESASEHCSKFGSFIEDFFNWNTSIRNPSIRFPSCKKFVQMYRSNRPSLEEY